MALRGGKRIMKRSRSRNHFGVFFEKKELPMSGILLPKHGKFFPDIRRKSIAFSWFFVQGKNREFKSPKISSRRFHPKFSHPKPWIFIMGENHEFSTKKIHKTPPPSRLSALVPPWDLRGSRGGMSLSFPIPKHSSGVYLPILKIPVPHTHPWDERHIYPAMNGSDFLWFSCR